MAAFLLPVLAVRLGAEVAGFFGHMESGRFKIASRVSDDRVDSMTLVVTQTSGPDLRSIGDETSRLRRRMQRRISVGGRGVQRGGDWAAVTATVVIHSTARKRPFEIEGSDGKIPVK